MSINLNNQANFEAGLTPYDTDGDAKYNSAEIQDYLVAKGGITAADAERFSALKVNNTIFTAASLLTMLQDTEFSAGNGDGILTTEELKTWGNPSTEGITTSIGGLLDPLPTDGAVTGGEGEFEGGIGTGVDAGLEPLPPAEPLPLGENSFDLSALGIDGVMQIDHPDAERLSDAFIRLANNSPTFKQALKYTVETLGSGVLTIGTDVDDGTLANSAPGAAIMNFGSLVGGTDTGVGVTLDSEELIYGAITHELGHSIEGSHQQVFGDNRYAPTFVAEGYEEDEHFGSLMNGVAFIEDVGNELKAATGIGFTTTHSVDIPTGGEEINDEASFRLDAEKWFNSYIGANSGVDKAAFVNSAVNWITYNTGENGQPVYSRETADQFYTAMSAYGEGNGAVQGQKLIAQWGDQGGATEAAAQGAVATDVGTDGGTVAVDDFSTIARTGWFNDLAIATLGVDLNTVLTTDEQWASFSRDVALRIINLARPAETETSGVTTADMERFKTATPAEIKAILNGSLQAAGIQAPA